MINADKPHRWNSDIKESVRAYNEWFTSFAPSTYLEKRNASTSLAGTTFQYTNNLRNLNPDIIIAHPEILPALRMSTLPPLAVDRLDGLATSNRSLIKTLETGKLPRKIPREELRQVVSRICNVINSLLDRQLLSWLDNERGPDEINEKVALSVIADRLSGAWADPVLRNAQENHQFDILAKFLRKNGFSEIQPKSIRNVTDLEQGKFAFRFNIKKRMSLDEANIPIDVIIQPHRAKRKSLPILVEAKSAGDWTNPNKRRKEEAKKIQQLRDRFGKGTKYILLLRGYFNPGYLGYEAADGFDWVWEHRIEDFKKLGI
jgi:hypothetical protein